MNKLILIVALSIAAIAKTVTVYDYGTSSYNTYDVQDTGTTTTVYDYQTSSYKTIY